MTTCVNTYYTNLHEAAEVKAEIEWERKSNTFADCLHSPVIYYKIENPTVADADRITKAFEAALGPVQIVFNEGLPSDTDWRIAGIAVPADWIVEKLCEEIICNGMNAAKAEEFIQNAIGGMCDV